MTANALSGVAGRWVAHAVRGGSGVASASESLGRSMSLEMTLVVWVK
jgi:hypothetical protein